MCTERPLPIRESTKLALTDETRDGPFPIIARGSPIRLSTRGGFAERGNYANATRFIDARYDLALGARRTAYILGVLARLPSSYTPGPDEGCPTAVRAVL